MALPHVDMQCCLCVYPANPTSTVVVLCEHKIHFVIEIQFWEPCGFTSGEAACNESTIDGTVGTICFRLFDPAAYTSVTPWRINKGPNKDSLRPRDEKRSGRTVNILEWRSRRQTRQRVKIPSLFRISCDNTTLNIRRRHLAMLTVSPSWVARPLIPARPPGNGL